MQINQHARLSVAPMMDWTDRHCRFFHRRMSRHALLYTEMVTAAALVRGGAKHLLEFGDAEQPVALQLGGADPRELVKAARMGANEGYGEINLNVGCPSDRVQSGCFGAVLMERPALVAECLAAMIAAVPQGVAVTVKCRIGVDDQQPEAVLPDFLAQVHAAGVGRVQIHARKAWLQGLSPKQNREIPPLDHALVHGMKAAFPDLHISLNGGITDLGQTLAHLSAGLDGVMIGRAAYQRPYDILGDADRRVFGATHGPLERAGVVAAMERHVALHLEGGGRLHQITRHMLGLFAGLPGARAWRRVLSERSGETGAGFEVLRAGLAAVGEVPVDA